MTDLELTNWTGVDAGGPFLLMFGHIDTDEDPDVMGWAKISSDGNIIVCGSAEYIDADEFMVYARQGANNNLIAKADNGGCTWSITDSVLTLEMDGVTIKVKQE